MFDEIIKQALSLITGSREKPFHSAAWRFWQENRPRIASPLTERSEVRKRALSPYDARGSMTLAEVNEIYPKTSPELEAQEEVYKLWYPEPQETQEQELALYSPKTLHRETGTKTRYKQWLAVKSIPQKLTFQEYWFLSEYLIAQGFSKVRKPNPYKYKHLAPSYEGRKFTSKVGRTYRNWLLMSVVSEDEQTKPVYYRAMCQACGHIIERFNYSRVAQRCGNCKRLENSLAITKADRPRTQENLPTTFSPIPLWQTPHGWIAQLEKPQGATSKLVVQELGSYIAVEKLESEPLKHNPQTEQREENLEDTPYSEKSAKVSTVQSLALNMEELESLDEHLVKKS